MNKLTVTLKSLKEIDNLPDDSVIQEFEYNDSYITFFDCDQNKLSVPIIMLGTTITLSNYEYDYQYNTGGGTESLSINNDNPKSMMIFRELVKKVVKGKIPEIKTFDLSSNVLSFNSESKEFTCGCEVIQLNKAEELIAFMRGCINSVKPVNKKPLK